MHNQQMNCLLNIDDHPIGVQQIDQDNSKWLTTLDVFKIFKTGLLHS